MAMMGGCSASFNPRLPLPGGDALNVCGVGWGGNQFQSTPPVAGRRCAIAVLVRYATEVSIHASRCREAMRRPNIG